MKENWERSEDMFVARYCASAALVAAAHARAPAPVLDALLDALRAMSPPNLTDAELKEGFV